MNLKSMIRLKEETNKGKVVFMDMMKMKMNREEKDLKVSTVINNEPFVILYYEKCLN